MNLLRDIAERGLTPEPIIVSRNTAEKWVVRDGNRRVAALQLLNDPDLCPAPALKKEIENLATEYAARIPDSIECLACDDEEVILRYLELKHTGENEGVGQERWDSLQQAVFNFTHNRPDQNKRAVQLVLWAEQQGIRVDNDFPLTTLNRILKRETLEMLGFQVVNDSLVPILDTESARRLVETVLHDLATGRVKVQDVFEPSQQIDYVRRVRTEVGPPLSETQSIEPAQHATSETEMTPTGAGAQPNHPGSATRTEGTPAGDQQVTARRVRVPKPSWERRRLFPRNSPGFNVPSDKTKVRNVLAELGRLDVTETPIAVAVLLRMLIEFSVGHYREVHGLGKEDKLVLDVAAVADHMHQQGEISDDQHELIIRRSREQGGMLHVRTLQKYVHSPDFHPSDQVLNTLWDEISFFVAKCWER
ncbi:ParB/Srx family N-terminal domain-containing protein [Caldinitratiruptor microaerophilus]|uniref:ParB/Sulfiredoxin domain-containing protein n=1 Tax=Caldinitratiruptor microaerophilus TaxID=671077 RepID=A0AA35CLJ3_9FIRM|nr:ParB/Srx family N-terminal domain-containing protein [Caldinitratiruptor microaerophilus]BDG59742.1 hypothetical protein caldi_08320 [Caldinitratiruptor microaerophilus]